MAWADPRREKWPRRQPSRTSQDAFAATGDPTADHLLEAAQTANRAVWDQAEANPEMRGMGTTLVALALVNDGRVAVINIGDSRLYVLHEGDLRQVTSDHNLVAELVAEGRLSKEEAEFHPRRNVITRAIGVDPEVPADLFLVDPVPGDRFLLCSDGLFRELGDDQIGAILRRLPNPQDAAEDLVAEAKFRGGNDNITVIVVDVIEPEPARRDNRPGAGHHRQTGPDTIQNPAIPAGGGAPSATDETRGTLEAGAAPSPAPPTTPAGLAPYGPAGG